MGEAEELIMVYALGAASHLEGGYGEDIFVPMPLTPKKYPRAPPTFHHALLRMLKGDEDFEIPNPWGETKEKSEPLRSAYSKENYWVEEQYMDKRKREIIHTKGVEYYDAIMAWRERRGGVSDPTSEFVVDKANVERWKPSVPPPWTAEEIRGSAAASTAAQTCLSEPAAEPGLLGEQKEEEAPELPIPPLNLQTMK